MADLWLTPHYAIRDVVTIVLVDADGDHLTPQLAIPDEGDQVFVFVASASGTPVGADVFRSGVRCSSLLIEGDPVSAVAGNPVTLTVDQETGLVSASV